jgi:lipopolysaccharide export system protein LptA
MVITTKKMTGVAVSGPNKTLELKTAHMSGIVHVVVTQPSSTKEPGKTQTVDLTSESANYTAADSTLDLLGNVTIENLDPADGRTMNLTGSSATVVVNLTAKKEADLVSKLTIKGLVEFKLNAKQKTTDPKTKTVSSEIIFIQGHANLLTYSSHDRTLVLIGNVEMVGSDPVFGSKMEGVDKAVITLDEDWNVTHVELTGNQASSTIQRKGGKD